MYSMRGADLVIKLLERQGIDIICGIPGGAMLPIYDALANSPIRHVLARHEQGAGFMAQGIARSTGKTAVCFATSGPGATNVLTAIADARSDSVPLVCITGQVSSGLLGTDAFQEVDIYGMSIPVTKHNFLIRSGKELLSAIPEAFSIAASGRPGPVLIDIPRDVQMGKVEFDAWPEPGKRTQPPAIPMDRLTRAVALLKEAKRPVLMAGGGVVVSGAALKVRALAERMGMPVSMSMLGLGTLPQDHPLYLGMLGMHGARFTNLVLDECDLLLVAGARLDDRATGKVNAFCPNAKVIHVDIDRSEHGKIRRTDINILGDVCEVFEYFMEHYTDDGNRRDAWVNRVGDLKKQFPLHMPDCDNPLSAYGIVKKVAEIVPDDTIVATDVGQHQMRAAQAYPLRYPRTWLSSGGQGTMGFGMPAAIGAALVHPDRLVVSFSGDGSLLMNIQEMATAVDQNVNMKVILQNNGGLGLIHQMQSLLFEGRNSNWKHVGKTDFVAVAKGFGMDAVDLSTSEDPEKDLREALLRPGPGLIQVVLDVRDDVYPVVPPGASNTDMIGD